MPGMVECGRCNKTYTNPFTHVCVAPIGKRRGRGSGW